MATYHLNETVLLGNAVTQLGHGAQLDAVLESGESDHGAER